MIQINSATKTGADRSGDTLYFLGFIFTTVTLGIALFKIGGNEREFATSIVLYDLGIGIATTVWGLVLRVLFSLMRTGTEEIESRTLSNLNQKSKSLSSKLISATQIAEETTAVVQQVLIETQNALIQVSSTTDAIIEKIYKETVDKHNSLLEKNTIAMQNLFERIDNVEVPSDLFSKKLDIIFINLEKSLSGLSRQINNISSLPNFFDAKIDAILSPISVTIESTDKAVNNFMERINSLSGIDLTSITKVSDSFTKLDKDISNLSLKLSDKSLDLHTLDSFIEQSGIKYLSAVEGLASKLEAIVLPSNQLHGLIENSYENYNDIVSNTTTSIINNSKNLTSEMISLKVSLSDLSLQVSAAANELKKSRTTGNFLDVFRR